MFLVLNLSYVLFIFLLVRKCVSSFLPRNRSSLESCLTIHHMHDHILYKYCNLLLSPKHKHKSTVRSISRMIFGFLGILQPYCGDAGSPPRDAEAADRVR